MGIRSIMHEISRGDLAPVRKQSLDLQCNELLTHRPVAAIQHDRSSQISLTARVVIRGKGKFRVRQEESVSSLGRRLLPPLKTPILDPRYFF